MPILYLRSLLQIRVQVFFHENGASHAQCDGMLRTQCQFSELTFDVYIELPGLLLQERSRASSTRFIHGVVHHNVFLYTDEFGILATDLEDGIDGGVKVNGRGRLRRNLVSDDVRPDIVAG